jgi:hypothetical protein
MFEIAWCRRAVEYIVLVLGAMFVQNEVFRNMSIGFRLFRLLMFTRTTPRTSLAWKCKINTTQNWCEQAMIEVFQRRLHTIRQSQEAMINDRRSDACHTTRQSKIFVSFSHIAAVGRTLAGVFKDVFAKEKEQKA